MSNKGLAAVRYTAQGFYVFPVGADKTPRWKWSRDATRDGVVAAQWWIAHPDDNVAIATKPSGLVVLDFDVCPEGKKLLGQTFYDGRSAFGYVATKLGRGVNDEGTYIVRTPSGGMHLYYRAPSDVVIGNRPILGVAGLMDVRAGGGAHGGYVLAPPSTNSKGDPYVGNDLPIADLPLWLIDLLKDKEKPVKEENPYNQPPGPQTWAHFADQVMHARPGERNRMLHWAATTMAEEGAKVDQVVDLLMEPFLLTGAHHTEDEAMATILSGFNTAGAAI